MNSGIKHDRYADGVGQFANSIEASRNTAAGHPQRVNTVSRVLVQTHETLLACESLAMQVRCSISNAPYPEANDEMDDVSIKRESGDVLMRCHDTLSRACAIKRQLEAALEVLG